MMSPGRHVPRQYTIGRCVIGICIFADEASLFVCLVLNFAGLSVCLQAKTKGGDTPLDLARQWHRTEVEKVSGCHTMLDTEITNIGVIITVIVVIITVIVTIFIVIILTMPYYISISLHLCRFARSLDLGVANAFYVPTASTDRGAVEVQKALS